MLKNREMYAQSENKFSFSKFSFVWFLFSTGSYLKNGPRIYVRTMIREIDYAMDALLDKILGMKIRTLCKRLLH